MSDTGISKVTRRTLAFDATKIREHLLQDLQIPKDLLQRAINKAALHIDAQKTLHFTHQGEVVQTVTVEDYETQQRAIDKIFRIADIYGRDSDNKNKKQNAAVIIETDPNTGVMRIIVGTEVESADDALPQGTILPHDSSPTLALSSPNAESAGEHNEDEPVSTIKVHKIKGLPADVYKALYGDDDA